MGLGTVLYKASLVEDPFSSDLPPLPHCTRLIAEGYRIASFLGLSANWIPTKYAQT